MSGLVLDVQEVVAAFFNGTLVHDDWVVSHFVLVLAEHLFFVALEASSVHVAQFWGHLPEAALSDQSVLDAEDLLVDVVGDVVDVGVLDNDVNVRLVDLRRCGWEVVLLVDGSDAFFFGLINIRALVVVSQFFSFLFLDDLITVLAENGFQPGNHSRHLDDLLDELLDRLADLLVVGLSDHGGLDLIFVQDRVNPEDSNQLLRVAMDVLLEIQHGVLDC